MAICKCCNRDMLEVTTVTCTGNRFVKFPNGQELPAVPFDSMAGERCHDCNIAHEGYHHPGCDMERCPHCGGQLISCGYLDKEETREERVRENQDILVLLERGESIEHIAEALGRSRLAKILGKSVDEINQKLGNNG